MLPYVYGSLTRISDLAQKPFTVTPLPREQWATGDYVVGEVSQRPHPKIRIELTNGRMVDVLEKDLLVGALGVRFATLEAVGSWQAIGDNLNMYAMTGAGLFGEITSKSAFMHEPVRTTYRGHVCRDGKKVCMADFVEDLPVQPLQIPVVLIVGTSMSAGKTSVARQIIHLFKRWGLTVVGAKLTGAGRYRDVLSMHDAGADAIFDFVDVGLPSSIMEPELFRERTEQLLTRIAAVEADVAVIEAGASPLEPYNGAVAMEVLGEQVKCTIVCASDPYAVVGIRSAFHEHIDLDVVAGVATNTEAGIQLIEKLTHLEAINFLDSSQLPRVEQLLREKLGL